MHAFSLRNLLVESGGFLLTSSSFRNSVFKMGLSISTESTEPMDLVGCVKRRKHLFSQNSVIFWRGYIIFIRDTAPILNRICKLNWDILFMSDYIGKWKFLFIEVTYDFS